MGWDWFGINLDDGTELLAMIHRDMETNKTAGAFGAVHFQGQEPLQLDKIDAKPMRYWRSPRTHIDYPVQWRLKIREIDAEFIVEPLADDQEIVMFGLLRAIWEGAGQIRGTIRGRPLTGRVRIELYGYGFIFNFQQYTGEYIRELDEDLKMYVYKTSAVIEGQAETLGGLTDVALRLIKAGVDFSRDFGVAFQITDDLHNLSRSKKWTKICGEDVLEGKMTLVLFQAIKKLESEPRKRLIAMIRSKERRKKEAMREAIHLIRSSGAVEATGQGHV